MQEIRGNLGTPNEVDLVMLIRVFGRGQIYNYEYICFNWESGWSYDQSCSNGDLPFDRD